MNKKETEIILKCLELLAEAMSYTSTKTKAIANNHKAIVLLIEALPDNHEKKQILSEVVKRLGDD